MKSLKEMVSQAIKDYMVNHKMNQREFYEYLRKNNLNVGTTTVNGWVRGEKAPTQGDNQSKLFQLIGLQINDSYNNIYDISNRKFPLLGANARDNGRYAKKFNDYISMVDNDIHADYCIICKGDSMFPVICNGDIVFIKKQYSVNDGEIAAIIIDGVTSLKRVYYSKDIITLITENKDYPPIIVNVKDNSSIQIVGKAVFYLSKIK